MKKFICSSIVLLTFQSILANITDVISNGGYENTSISPWSLTTGWHKPTTAGTGCYGSFYALTSNSSGVGVDYVNGSMTQSCNLPSGTINNGTLSFCLKTLWGSFSGGNSTVPSDSLIIKINGSTLIKLTHNSSNIGSSYYSFSYFLTSSIIGTGGTLTLEFYAKSPTDNKWTKWYIDNVVLDIDYNPCTQPSNPNPLPDNDILCPSASTIVDVMNPCTGCAYTWSTPTGSKTGESITATTTGTYTVTATNSCNLSASGSTTILASVAPIKPLPDANDDDICPSGAVGTIVAVSNPETGCSYQWTKPNGGSQIGETFTGYSSGTYSVTATNSCNQTNSGSFYLPPTPNPQNPALLSANANPCPNSGTYVNITNYNTNYSYLWSTNVLDSNHFAYVPIVTTPKSISVTVTNTRCGLTSSTSTTISPMPDTFSVNIASSGKKLCSSSNSSHTDQLVVSTSPACVGCAYQWSTNPSVNGSGAAVIVNQSGTYTVTVTNSCGIDRTGSKNVQGLGVPMVEIKSIPDTLPCRNSTVQLTAQIKSDTNYAHTYVWANSSCTSKLCTFSGEGPYSVTITNICGTSSNDLGRYFPINPSNVKKPIFSSTNLSVCRGNTAKLSIKSESRCEGCTYQWVCNNCIGNFNDTIITVTDTGNIKVIATNTCGDTMSNTLKVTNSPIANIQSTSTQFCNGDSILLTASNGTKYRWSTGQTSQSIFAKNATNYSVVVTNPLGCSDSANASISLSYKPSISVNAGLDQEIDLGQTVALGGNPTAYNGTGSYSYSWNGNVSNPTSPNPTASMNGNFTYCVTVSDGVNCASSDCMLLKLPNSGCNNITLSKEQNQFDYDGGTDIITVNAPNFCNWKTVNSDTNMIQIVNGKTGWGTDPRIQILVRSCPDNINRTATINVMGKVYTAKQNCNCQLIGNPIDTVLSCSIMAKDQSKFKIPVVYKWYNGSTLLDSSLNFEFKVKEKGNYKVKVYSQQDEKCYIESGWIEKDKCSNSAINQTQNTLPIIIYPNPASNTIKIQIPQVLDSKILLSIYDIKGSVVLNIEDKCNSSNYSKDLDVSSLANGQYLIRIMSDKELFESKFEVIK